MFLIIGLNLMHLYIKFLNKKESKLFSIFYFHQNKVVNMMEWLEHIDNLSLEEINDLLKGLKLENEQSNNLNKVIEAIKAKYKDRKRELQIIQAVIKCKNNNDIVKILFGIVISIFISGMNLYLRSKLDIAVNDLGLVISIFSIITFVLISFIIMYYELTKEKRRHELLLEFIDIVLGDLKE